MVLSDERRKKLQKELAKVQEREHWVYDSLGPSGQAELQALAKQKQRIEGELFGTYSPQQTLFNQRSDDEMQRIEALNRAWGDLDLEDEMRLERELSAAMKKTNQTLFNKRSGSVTVNELENLIAENNAKYGTRFSLGGAYGNWELWSDGKERLDAGSKDDIYKTFIKYRFNEKYRFDKQNNGRAPIETDEMRRIREAAEAGEIEWNKMPVEFAYEYAAELAGIYLPDETFDNERSVQRHPLFKDSDIKVGRKFKLANGEVIEIKREFKENLDEDWVEFTRNGKSNEGSVHQLRIFINNWRERPWMQNQRKVDDTPIKAWEISYGKPKKNEFGEWEARAYARGRPYEPADIYQSSKQEVLDTIHSEMEHASKFKELQAAGLANSRANQFFASLPDPPAGVKRGFDRVIPAWAISSMADNIERVFEAIEPEGDLKVDLERTIRNRRVFVAREAFMPEYKVKELTNFIAKQLGVECDEHGLCQRR